MSVRPFRALQVLAVVLFTAMAVLAWVPPAQRAFAATAVTVTSPGSQNGTIGVATSLSLKASGGTSPYTWSASGLPGGLSIAASTGVVSGSPTAAGTASVIATAKDASGASGKVTFSWVVTAPVTVSNPGSQNATVGVAASLTLAASGGASPYTWSASGLPAGLVISTSTGSVTGSPTAAGSYSTTVTARDGSARTGTTAFSWVVTTPVAVLNPGTRNGTTGTAVNYTVSASGGTTPYIWSASGMPAGLSISSTSGAITGTPTAAGSSTVKVTATDKVARVGSATFTWQIAGPVNVTNPGNQTATTGAAVSLALGAAGGATPYSWSVTGLPSGLAINASSGAITGTPNAAGSTAVRVTATDTAGRTGSASFTWTVSAPLVWNASLVVQASPDDSPSQTVQFSTDQLPTFTATVNQDISAVAGGKYNVYIVNVTSGDLLGRCLGTSPSYAHSAGSTVCTHTAYPQYGGVPKTGGPQQYKAIVATGYTPPAQFTDVQASSSPVTMSRTPWTLTLTTDKTEFSTVDPYFVNPGGQARLTATTNQSTYSANGTMGPYEIYLIDTSDNRVRYRCDSGVEQQDSTVHAVNSASCSSLMGFRIGPARSYVAVIAASGIGPSPKPYNRAAQRSPTYLSQLTDIQVVSAPITLSRAAWTIGLTAYPNSGSGNHRPALGALVNQQAPSSNRSAYDSIDTNEDAYRIVFADYGTGPITSSTNWEGWVYLQSGKSVASCASSPSGYSPNFDWGCGTEVEWPTDGLPHMYAAYVTRVNRQTGAIYDIQAVSNSIMFQQPNSPLLDGEAAGGSNPSENLCDPCQGDPVDTATGEYYANTTDLTLPGAGPAIALTRNYGSSLTTNGPLGTGWTTDFGTNLSFQGGDSTDPQPRTVVVHQENGSTLLFSEGADRKYQALSRVHATLEWNTANSTWVLIRRAALRFTFDSAGRLTKETDLNGNQVALAYDSNQNLTSVTGSGGRRIDLTWSGGHVARAVDSAGRVVSYGYTANNLTSVTAPDSHVTTYGYDVTNRLTSATTPRGGVLTNEYDAQGRVISQTDAMHNQMRFSYDGNTTTTTLPDSSAIVETFSLGLRVAETVGAGTPDAVTTSFSYDANNNLVSVADPLNAVSAYTYDNAGNTLTRADALNRRTTWTYNEFNEPLTKTDPAGHATGFTYDSGGNRTTLTTPLGHQQRWTYNTNGTVATATDATNGLTSYTYDASGQLTSNHDPDNRTTQVGYDSAGNVTSLTSANGAVTRITVDPVGRVITATDPINRVTRYTYDADGNETAVMVSGARETTTTYDLLGHPLTVGDGAGHTIRYDYTATGQLHSTTDANGNTTTNTYDARQQLIGTTDGAGNTTLFTFDTAGRPSSTTTARGSSSGVSYDLAGQSTSSTDLAGQTTTYSYDGAGRLNRSTDPNGNDTTYSYDNDDRPSTTTRPDGTVETSTFDAANRLKSFTDPDGQTSTYTFDSAGLLTAKTGLNGRAVTQYTYDNDGRMAITTRPDSTTVTRSYNDADELTRVHYSAANSQDVTYGYNDQGQRTEMTDQTGATTYQYDAAQRLSRVTNGSNDATGYTYDNAGNITILQYPGQRNVTYSYDAANRMTNVTDWNQRTTTFGWNPDSELVTQAGSNGLSQTNNYDPAGRVTSIADTNASGGTTALTYSYNNRSQKSSLTTNTATYTYNYNPVDQLAGVAITPGGTTGAATTAAYTNSPGGRLTGIPDSSTLQYNAAGQLTQLTRPLNAPVTSYTYNPNGDRTGAQTATQSTTYDYDPSGSLQKVRLASGTAITYTSNGDGLRQTRSQGAATQHFTWDLNGPTVPRIIDDGNYAYLYGPSDTPYAQVNDATGRTDYLNQDATGTPVLLTDTNGNTTATNEWDPYGNRTTHTGAADTTIGYTGAWTDPATGMVNLNARDYDPTTGQFISTDPAVDLTYRPYAYAHNDPLNRTDRAGLFDIDGTLEFINKVNPMRPMVEGFAREYQAYDSGCSFADSFRLGIEGTLHSVANIALLSDGLSVLQAAKGVIAVQVAARAAKTAPEVGGGGQVFTHFTNADGAAGIAGVGPLNVGESVGVSGLRFGRGDNAFMAGASGDNFVTDLGLTASPRQLEGIGMFGSKQQYALQFSQEAALNSGLGIRPVMVRENIFTIPSGSCISGACTATRVR